MNRSLQIPEGTEEDNIPTLSIDNTKEQGQAQEEMKEQQEAENWVKREAKEDARREEEVRVKQEAAEQTRREAEEIAKKEEKERIKAQIADLNIQLNDAKGLFGAFKRRKLQDMINKLTEQLNVMT